MLLVHRTMLTSFSICCWFSEPCFSNEPQGWQRGFPTTVMFFRAFRVLKIWGGPTFKVPTCANYHSRQIWDTWVWLQGRGQSANSPDFTTWAPPISSLRGQQPSIFECWKTLQFGLVCLLFLPKAESETGMSALVALKFSWYFNGHHRPTKKPHRKTMTHPALGGSIDLPFLDTTPIGWIPPSSPAAGAKKCKSHSYSCGHDRCRYEFLWFWPRIMGIWWNMCQTIHIIHGYIRKPGICAHENVDVTAKRCANCGTGATFGYFMHIYFSKKRTSADVDLHVLLVISHKCRSNLSIFCYPLVMTNIAMENPL